MGLTMTCSCGRGPVTAHAAVGAHAIAYHNPHCTRAVTYTIQNPGGVTRAEFMKLFYKDRRAVELFQRAHERAQVPASRFVKKDDLAKGSKASYKSCIAPRATPALMSLMAPLHVQSLTKMRCSWTSSLLEWTARHTIFGWTNWRTTPWFPWTTSWLHTHL